MTNEQAARLLAADSSLGPFPDERKPGEIVAEIAAAPRFGNTPNSEDGGPLFRLFMKWFEKERLRF